MFPFRSRSAILAVSQMESSTPFTPTRTEALLRAPDRAKAQPHSASRPQTKEPDEKREKLQLGRFDPRCARTSGASVVWGDRQAPKYWLSDPEPIGGVFCRRRIRVAVSGWLPHRPSAVKRR
jgi:hypothetical protein